MIIVTTDKHEAAEKKEHEHAAEKKHEEAPKHDVHSAKQNASDVERASVQQLSSEAGQVPQT